jgi:hypothetical protein
MAAIQRNHNSHRPVGSGIVGYPGGNFPAQQSFLKQLSKICVFTHCFLADQVIAVYGFFAFTFSIKSGYPALRPLQMCYLSQICGVRLLFTMRIETGPFARTESYIMRVDMFVKIGDLKGKAQDKTHKVENEVLS